MPTGCKSVYLFASQYHAGFLERGECGAELPAGDLKGRAKDLSTYKLGHGEEMAEAASGKAIGARWSP